ncbi:MAG TPA: type II toxin-antitoxin system VapC family toxin [Candidatus Bathyarchaeia archaeon]|nr:type II toxin-antitoxin system VapC family toxin [Candidatus Bathyarchaeia archaeon]
MRFLDANVFVYAYYKPKKQLTQKERQMKEQAKKIVADVSQGREQVIVTVVHLSEAVNILKHGMPLERLTNLVRGLFMLDNVTVHGVSREAYFAAVELGDDLRLEANDALAVDVMRQSNVTEVFTFDEDFDHVEGITRLPK